MVSVVILIIAHKSRPTDVELASLKQCHRILAKYRIIMVCPRGLDISVYRQAVPSLEFDFIDPKWHSSYKMFNRMKIVPLLYQKHKRSEYILFYELDAWVFRDELEYWCGQGYDYIGAPWFEGLAGASVNSEFAGVGNGGFSLRKVESHLRAIHRFSYVMTPAEVWKQFKSDTRLKAVFVMLLNLTIRNNTFFLFNNFRRNEDLFWGRFAARNFGWKMPEMTTAARFSLELNAEMLYEKNNQHLPFGCHKWEKYDTGFWRKFINPE